MIALELIQWGWYMRGRARIDMVGVRGVCFEMMEVGDEGLRSIGHSGGRQ